MVAKASKKRKAMASVFSDKKVEVGLDVALDRLGEYKEKFSKFDETVEVAFCLGLDPRHADQQMRGMVEMPNGLGKTVRVAVICTPEKIKEAEASGADLVGSEDIIAKIQKGETEFDVLIAEPAMMAKLGVCGKILGPKGLMPNPKLGTVTPNFKEAVRKAKAGQVEFRVEKAGIVHAGIGKLSFGSAKLKKNIMTLYNAVNDAKPSGAKGVFMKRMYLSTSMGPSIKLDLGKIME
jgi:large subunit ribosomal protein L1